MAALLLLSAFFVHAQTREKVIRVVATNSWTAAFAAAAGAKDIVTLAPSELRHPVEYEMKPSDFALLKGAGLIVTTGFEVMAKHLAEAAGRQKIRVVRIDADYSLATLRTSILAIADILGTQDQARTAIAQLEAFLSSWKQELRDDNLYGAPIVVHLFQQPLMAELGFTIKGGFRACSVGGCPDRQALCREGHLYRGQLAQRSGRAAAGIHAASALRRAHQFPWPRRY